MRPLLLVCVLLALSFTLASAAEPALVAHWSFDEGQGAVARDVTGHGHDAALKNTEWVRSPRGYALRFDSKDDLAQYGQVDTMNMSGDMTLAVWVKTDGSVAPRTHRLIFGDGGYGIERNVHLSLDSYDRLSFEWADGKANASILAPAALLNGTWKQVVVVANSTARHITLYVDGVVVAEMPMPLPISKAPVKERLTGWFYSGFFQGDLDDIKLYSRALSAAEVRRAYAAEADLEVGSTRVLFDASGTAAQGQMALALHNWSKESRRVAVSGLSGAPREMTLPPGAQTDVALGAVALQPVWPRRSDLFLCDAASLPGKVTVTTYHGQDADTQPVAPVAQSVLEPLQVVVSDPWQARLTPGKTAEVAVRVKLALAAKQLRGGVLELQLVSRETGKRALSRQLRAPGADQPLRLDVRALPWGAYDLQVTFRNAAGRAALATTRQVTVLPGGPQQIRVLNNLVSELMDARARDLLNSRRIEFMNPRQGWVWFRAAGTCTVQLGKQRLLSAAANEPPAEAMRLLPAGKQVLQITGTPTALTVRAIPALFYNVYPSGPQITPFGNNTWERLRKHTLGNCNMIEAQVVDTPEQREWEGQGKLWIANVQAPGLIDKTEWTVEKMLEVWLNPGKPTAWAAKPGFDLSKFGGLQIDEYYPGGPPTPILFTTAQSVARLAEDPTAAGKLWIPFVVNMYGTPAAELFMKTVLGCGWPYSVEVYVGEEPTEAEDRASIRTRFLSVASSWEKAYPGSVRRAIFTPMYAYLPYCTTNRYPQADFRAHLDLQMQMLATDPAFFGLWGVQPYRSNYVDEEILNCMGRMLRHYCLEGRTDRMLSDPYELRHVADPDFAAGLTQWQVAPAEAGSVSAGKFAGYGQLEGRYPGGAMGDTFLLLTQSAKAPNVVSQQLKGLQAGRLYSLKVITGDYSDLKGGQSRKLQQVLGLTLEGAEVQPGGFRTPFRSARGPKPFDRETPFWMTYHWLQFRAQGPKATLRLSDWAEPNAPGGAAGQQLMVNFVEVQPVLEETAAQ